MIMAKTYISKAVGEPTKLTTWFVYIAACSM